MVLKKIVKSQVSPQYLREEKIHVTIIEAKNPVHYVIRESPSMNVASTYASKFLELEESMQKYYGSLEKTFFQLPVKDTILIVEHSKKFYRAKVCSILNLPTSYLIKVYLLDYGKECTVPKSSLFEMHPDFMSVQFQVIDFKLPGLDPVSLVMNSLDLSVEYGVAVDWDSSASIFIENLRKTMRDAFIKVEGASKNCIYGTLHVTLQDGEEKCINDELVFEKFAFQNPECWNNITRLADILSKENILPSPSNNLEIPVPSCIISESMPVSDLSSLESPKSIKSPAASTIVSESLPVCDLNSLESPKSIKLAAASTIVSEPLKKLPKSSVAKLREILRAKRLQLSKPFPEREKELLYQNNTSRLCLKQKDMPKELEETNVELVEDDKDACDPSNETIQNIEEHSTEGELITIIEETSKSNTFKKDSPSSSEDTALKTLEESKFDQNVSSYNKSPIKQQNVTQTRSNIACSNSLSQIPQHETNSPPVNHLAPELDKNEKLSQHTDILQIPTESEYSDSSQCLPACGRVLEVKCIPQPSNSVPGQEIGINASQPIVKSDNELSGLISQASLKQEEVSRIVDKAKIRAFYQRHKRARALFLAKNKTELEQNDANTELAATSSVLEPTETKTVDESSEVSSTQTETELASIETNSVVESCKESSDANNMDFVGELSENHKSMESQSPIEPKEITKPKVNTAKLKAFYERNKKARAQFLAQAKSNHDQDNKSSQSELTSPSSVASLSSETDSLSVASPEIKDVLASDTIVPDVLDLIDIPFDSNSSSSSKSDKYPESETESLSLMQEESLEPVDFSSKSLFDKQKVPALCLGEGVPTPVLALSEIMFHPSIKKTLEALNFEGPSCIQSIVWPAAFRNRCLAAIAPPSSGKTVAYLLPIVSNFLNKVYMDSEKSKGPMAIIICSSWRKVQHVYDLLQLFMKGSKFKILTFFADGRSMRRKVTTLMNGCDILISVPSILLNFFKENSVCVHRCCHFILDDGANLLSSHMNEIKSIMGLLGEAIKLRPTISSRLQILINSERWTKGVASFVDKFLCEPLLLFTSFLEAAIYTNIEILPHICNELDKKQKLVEIVKACGKRTIVCTQDIIKASEIHSFLLSENIRSFLVTEEMEHFISEGIIQDWKCVNSGLPYCLIITDPALTGITLCDANYIIHYDVPEISRLQFGNRFGLIAEHFQKSKIDCGSHILISEMCAKQALSILKIIKRMGMDVPKDLSDFVNKQRKVVDNFDAPLCRFFKAFGLCKLPHCEKRHHINSVVDQPKVIFREGQVEAKVTHIFDASHFCVRVMKYTPPDCEQSVSLSSEYAEMGLKLKTFYSIESNRKVIDCPVIGGNYIIEYGNNFFYRVTIMSIVRSSEANSQITLLFRDDGFIKSHEVCELYEDLTCDDLPPPHAVEVFLCNVCTPDSCLDWNPQANDFVKKLVMDRAVHGKIVLCLGETLWLNPLVLREKLVFNNDYLNVVSVGKSLKDAEFALENKDHLPLLFKACENKIQLPIQKSSRPSEKIIEDVKIQVFYAFLDLNVHEDVYVSSVFSPHRIYVQRVKFVDCLEELLEKINAQVDAKKLKKCSTLQNGMHCIAPFLDNRYYRATITNVSSDLDDVRLFFVDFGDSCCASKDSIFNLPYEFTLLPFQAIECELDGICEPHGGWSDKAADFIEDVTRNETNDMIIVEIKAYTKLTSYDAGNRYKVDIWNGEKTLSDQLLSEGLVDPAEKFISVEVPIQENEDKEFFEDDLDGPSLSSDDDVPAENKDHHALFCAALSKMLLQNMSNTDAANEAISELNKSKKQEKFKDEDISVNEKVEESVNEDFAVLNSPILALQRLLDFKKKNENSKKTRPTVSWWDSSDEVHMLLKLKDIQLYELDIKDNSFMFKTSVKGVDYYIEEHFYDAIHSKDCIEKNRPEGLSIILKKQVEKRWPRLMKENKKVHYIKYDLEHIDVSDSEDLPEDNIKIPPVTVPSEDEDSTDDENSVPQWKKLAEFKDPYNPFD